MKQLLAVSTLLALSLTPQAFAQDGCQKQIQMAFPYRLFHADGEHQCWSKDFIGYKCSVSGVGYTDCQQAFFALQRDNCCSRMLWQGKVLQDGRSVDFKVTKCTNWT